MATPQEARVAIAAAANALMEADFPAGGDFLYHQSTVPAFGAAAKALGERALALLERFQGWPVGVVAEDEAEACEALTGVLDTALDRVDVALDAAAAARASEVAAARAAAATAPASAPAAATRVARAPAPVRYVASLARPQDTFPDRVDNSPTPFILPPPFGQAGAASGSGSTHPLADTIRALRPNAEQLSAPAHPAPPAPLDSTPCTMVDTPEALAALAAALRDAEGGAIAVDLEAHSYRSFQGFVCLMQLSTRREDYLVDTLALRGHIRAALAPVFQDASIVKVMHGADSDVVWLQRDFGIYVVNLFDTGQAARLLGLPSAGLAYLLELLCGVRPDKRFQLADWRLRPLSADMAHYARCDTHYLLHAYDRVRDLLRRAPAPQLPPPDGDVAGGAADAPYGGGGGAVYAYVPAGSEAGAGALPAAWARGAAVSVRVYRREGLPGEGAAAKLAERAGAPLSAAALAVLGALLTWRDAVARAADESTGYVLSKAAALRLTAAATAAGGGSGGTAAEEACTPRAVAAACARDAPFAAARAAELADVISRARRAFADAEARAAAAAVAAAAAAAAPQPQPAPLELWREEAAAAAEAAEAPPRKRRALVLGLAAPLAGGCGAGGLGALLGSARAPEKASQAEEEEEAAAARVRASFALPFAP